MHGVLSIRGIRGLLAVDEIILGECVDQESLASHRIRENIRTYRLVLEQETGKASRKNGAFQNSMKSLCYERCQRAPRPCHHLRPMRRNGELRSQGAGVFAHWQLTSSH